MLIFSVILQVLTGRCIAAATSPLEGVERGLLQFIGREGISPSKLVLGVPWYGYRSRDNLAHITPSHSVTMLVLLDALQSIY